MIGRALASVLRGYVSVTPQHPGRGVLGRFASWLDPRVRERELWPGVRLRLHLGNPNHFNYWVGDWIEEVDGRIFLSHLRPGMTVLDIGANMGLYALAAAKAVGDGGRVFAFEPLPHVRQYLAENVELNGLTNVTAVPIALSDHAGTATFHLGLHDSMSSLVRPTGTGRTIDVPTRTLDSYLAEQGVERVDAIKMDVEGAEALVLRGMAGLLSADHKPVILIEINHGALAVAGSSAEDVFGTIVSYGYRANAMVGDHLQPVDRLMPPNPYSEPLRNYIFVPAREPAA